MGDFIVAHDELVLLTKFNPGSDVQAAMIGDPVVVPSNIMPFWGSFKLRIA